MCFNSVFFPRSNLFSSYTQYAHGHDSSATLNYHLCLNWWPNPSVWHYRQGLSLLFTHSFSLYCIPFDTHTRLLMHNSITVTHIKTLCAVHLHMALHWKHTSSILFTFKYRLILLPYSGRLHSPWSFQRDRHLWDSNAIFIAKWDNGY